MLKLKVHESHETPFAIKLSGYSGNGTLTLGDWSGGTELRTFQYSGQELVELDVTAKIQSLRAAGASHAGFRLRFKDAIGIRSCRMARICCFTRSSIRLPQF